MLKQTTTAVARILAFAALWLAAVWIVVELLTLAFTPWIEREVKKACDRQVERLILQSITTNQP